MTPITEDKNHPRLIKVALLSLHVAFTLPGHPEFVWASFEHTTGAPDASALDAHRNVAPLDGLGQNPTLDDPLNQRRTDVISNDNHLLYKGGTPTNTANLPYDEASLVFDEGAQWFSGQQTSIYRMFPASKSNTSRQNDAVTSLNHNMEGLFSRAQLDPADERGYYRLVGAVWMDKPALFQVNSSFQNDMSSPLLRGDVRFDISQADERRAILARGSAAEDLVQNGAKSPFSILGGEDRLSSTAIESFTQGPASFPNCFTCHNTHATTVKGVPYDRDFQGTKLLEPKLINVSHVFSQFALAEEHALP
jgi:hypothetical protein